MLPTRPAAHQLVATPERLPQPRRVVRCPLRVLRLCLLLPHLQPFSNMTGQEPKKEAPQLRLLWGDQLEACLLDRLLPDTHLRKHAP
jgi:hypothetical protein